MDAANVVVEEVREVFNIILAHVVQAEVGVTALSKARASGRSSGGRGDMTALGSYCK
jgi:hypothetical protein